MSNLEEQVNECPICMDCIDNEKNKVITDCGHCFHTSCLMQNAAHNGFGCPYCRQVLASTPDEETEYDTDDDGSSYNEDNDDDDDEDNSNGLSSADENYCLRGMRWLFQRANGEEVDNEEDVEDDEIIPDISPEIISESLISNGFSMVDLVKVILTMNGDLFNRQAEANIDVVFRHIRELKHKEDLNMKREQERMSREDTLIST